MTQIKYPSYKMPHVNASSYTLGGHAWFTNAFKPADTSTYTGIFLDPDGSFTGAAHEGLTIWKSGVKQVQLNKDTFVVGAAGGHQLTYTVSTGAFTVPVISTNIIGAGTLSPTFTGVALYSGGIKAYNAGTETFFIDATNGNLTLGKAGGQQMTYTESTGFLKMPAISTEHIFAGALTGTGIILDTAGLQAKISNVQTFLLDATTGDLTVGKSTHHQLKYTASTGVFQVPYISTSAMYAGSLYTGDGVWIDNNGIYGYKTAARTFYIETSGNFSFGSTTNKKISFVASTGVLTFDSEITVTSGSTAGTLGKAVAGGDRAYLGLDSAGRAVLEISSNNITGSGGTLTNGVLIDTAGIRGYASSVQVFGINTSGTAFFKGKLDGASLSASQSLSLGDYYSIIPYPGNLLINATNSCGIVIGASTTGYVDLTSGSVTLKVDSNGIRLASSTFVDTSKNGWFGNVNATGNFEGNTGSSWFNGYGSCVRELYGRNGASYDHVFVNYGAAGKGMYIGDSGTDHPLTVYGTVTAAEFSGYIGDRATSYIETGAEKAHSICDDYGNVSGTTLYAVGNCSAASFTDRTTYPDTLKKAYDVILSMKTEKDKDGKNTTSLDHTALDPFVAQVITDKDGVAHDGRDMSATISCLVEVVKYLMDKNGGIN